MNGRASFLLNKYHIPILPNLVITAQISEPHGHLVNSSFSAVQSCSYVLFNRTTDIGMCKASGNIIMNQSALPFSFPSFPCREWGSWITEWKLCFDNRSNKVGTWIPASMRHHIQLECFVSSALSNLQMHASHVLILWQFRL